MSRSNAKLRRSASFPLVKRPGIGLEQNSSYRNQSSNSRYSWTMNTPMRPSSVRDLNDQIAALRRENFNLKLDLFLLRESYGSNGNGNNDRNELGACKRELEELRRELRKKSDMIKEALDGMRYMEDAEEQIEQRYAAKIAELQQKIHVLEESNDENMVALLELTRKP